jgi:hypothetical protein
MSQLDVDKLSGRTTNGSITVVGEGNTITTNLQQGLAKHFLMYNQESDTVMESFNQASKTDSSAGNFIITFSNIFGNVNYCSSGISENQYTTVRGGNVLSIATQFDSSGSLTNGTALSSSARTYTTKYGSSGSSDAGYADHAPVMVINHGDLA